MPLTRSQKHSLHASLGAGLTVFVLLALPLLTGLVYFGLDLTLLDLGVDCALRHQLSHGDGLLLSSYMGNGAQFMTRPSVQFFYPLRWLALLFPGELWIGLNTIGHVAIAAAGSALLVRSYGGHKWTAYFAGLLFAFSGTTLNLLIHTNTFVTGVAWLPWAWAMARFALHPRAGRWTLIVCGLSLSAMLLGGGPQSFLMASGMITIETLRYMYKRRDWRRPLIVIALIPAAFGIGMLLWGGFFAESMHLGRRMSGLADSEALCWSLDSSLWPAVLIPALPNTTTQGYFWGALFSTHPGSWNPNPYLGLTLVSLSLVGLFMRRTQTAAIAFVGALLLATGSATPLGKLLLHAIPPLAMFRYPQKYFIMVNLAAVVLASLVVQRSLRSQLWRRRALLSMLSMLSMSLIAASLLAWLSPEFANDPGLKILAGSGDKNGILSAWSPGALAILKIAQSGLFLALAIWVFKKHHKSVKYVLIIMACDLFFASAPLLNIGASLRDLPSPLMSPLSAKNSANFAVFCNHNTSYFSSFTEDEAPDWAKSALYRIYLISELQACEGIVSAVPYSPVQSAATKRLNSLFASGELKAADALGCSHILVAKKIPSGRGLTRMYLHGAADAQANINQGPKLYKLDHHLPITFVSPRPQLLLNEDEVFEMLQRGESFSDMLNVIDDPVHRLSPAQQLPQAADDVKIDKLDWPRRDKATLHLSGTGAAVIALRTVFQVGWQARQNGRELTVLRATGQHVAVVVDDVSAGPVELKYKTPFFIQSIIAAIFGFLAMLGLAWFAGRKTQINRPRRKLEKRAVNDD